MGTVPEESWAIPPCPPAASFDTGAGDGAGLALRTLLAV